MSVQTATRPRLGPEFALLVAASAALAMVRVLAARRVGFGDAEALYACYGLHPQPAYLDHPGLIGLVARALGGGTAPEPASAHVVTGAIATLIPWMMALTCRACGASWRRSFGAGLVLAVVPETAIGLFALTPDLPLAVAWIGGLGFAAVAVRSPPASLRAAIGFLAAGLCAGIASASKASGVLLFGSLAVAYGSKALRPHVRTAGPWAGLAAGALIVAPIAVFEWRTGWPMLRHRFVDTQAGAGPSLRNLAALLGGQAAYVSPLLLLAAVFAARTAWRERRDAVGSLLFCACALPAAPLIALCLWSPVAEPHWLAPAGLALLPAAARAKAAPSRRLMAAATALAASAVVAVHAWVLVPALARWAPAYDPRLDIANELYGWPEVAAAVREEAAGARGLLSDPNDLVVVGPHWVICAQLEAALKGRLAVGCDTPIPDDFDTWLPRKRWRSARVLVWVTDARFGPPPTLRAYAALRTRAVRIERAGRVVRTFTIATLARRAVA